MAQFQINKVYNFNTLAPTILGSNYSNMKVLSMLNAKEALKYEDIYTLHNNLLPAILGLPQDVNDCVFLLLETIDGTKKVYAIEYIDPFSIVEVVTTNIRLELFNTNLEDLNIIRARMLELGYNDFNLTTF